VPVSVRLDLANQTLPAAPSANVVGEVVGRKKDQVVLLGCHLDSWDVGTGAQDDGAACVAVMEAVALIAALPDKPRRTVRAVLFTNEENGVAGGKAYVDANMKLEHVALIESDTGMGGTLGFYVERGTEEDSAAAVLAVAAFIAPLAQLGVTEVAAGHAGVDVGPTLRARGGLGLGVKHEMSTYWPIHHTEADTVEKIDPKHLQTEVAALAALAWMLAEADTLPGEGR
jgi:carboxypeptidase Q